MSFIFAKGKRNQIDGIALEILFEDYYDKVYRTAFSILLDTELAKDATQEAFAKAFNKIDTLREKNKFGSWVCSIATNICKDILKQVIIDRNKNISIYDSNGKTKEYMYELIDFNIPDKIYDNIEMRHELQYCINQLDKDTRIIINLRYYYEFTYREIAEIMNMKEGTIKTKIHRGKKKLAIILERYFDIKEVGDNVQKH